MISMEMLQDARRVLSPVINQTPVLHAPGLVPDCDFYLKADPAEGGRRRAGQAPRRAEGSAAPAGAGEL